MESDVLKEGVVLHFLIVFKDPQYLKSFVSMYVFCGI